MATGVFYIDFCKKTVNIKSSQIVITIAIGGK